MRAIKVFAAVCFLLSLSEYACAADRDRDGIPDQKELAAIRPGGDIDGDGLSNRRESRAGTKIDDEDTDNDGLDDGADLKPRDSDADDDGIEDGDEDADQDGIDNEDEDDEENARQCSAKEDGDSEDDDDSEGDND